MGTNLMLHDTTGTLAHKPGGIRLENWDSAVGGQLTPPYGSGESVVAFVIVFLRRPRGASDKSDWVSNHTPASLLGYVDWAALAKLNMLKFISHVMLCLHAHLHPKIVLQLVLIRCRHDDHRVVAINIDVPAHPTHHQPGPKHSVIEYGIAQACVDITGHPRTLDGVRGAILCVPLISNLPLQNLLESRIRIDLMVELMLNFKMLGSNVGVELAVI